MLKLDDKTAYHVKCGCGSKRKVIGKTLRPLNYFIETGKEIPYAKYTCKGCGNGTYIRMDSPQIELYKPRVPKTQYIGMYEVEYHDNWVLGYRPTSDKNAVYKWKNETIECINVLNAKVYQIKEV